MATGSRQKGAMRTASQSSGAVFAAVMLGLLTGENAKTLARGLVLLFDDAAQIDPYDVSVVSLFLLLIGAGGFAAGGAFAAQRQWIGVDRAVLAVVVAVSSAGAIALESNDRSLLGQPLYFLGWIVVMWLAPLLLLPNRDNTLQGWTRRACGLLAVAAPMTVVGLAVGFFFQEIVMRIGEVVLAGGDLDWGNSEAIWIARPQAVNAVCGAYVVVAFATVWWRGLGWTRKTAYIWTVGTMAFAAPYAGVWGFYFYAPGEWSAFWAFSTFPVAGGGAVLLAYMLARRVGLREVSVGWPVSKWFWVWLPLVLAVGCSVCAFLGLATIQDIGGRRLGVLVVAHALNGGVMGVSLYVTRWLFRLVPSAEVPRAFSESTTQSCRARISGRGE